MEKMVRERMPNTGECSLPSLTFMKLPTKDDCPGLRSLVVFTKAVSYLTSLEHKSDKEKEGLLRSFLKDIDREYGLDSKPTSNNPPQPQYFDS